MHVTASIVTIVAIMLSVSATPLDQRSGTCDLTTPEYCPGDPDGCKEFVSLINQLSRGDTTYMLHIKSKISFAHC
jgi:hypothetical protein